ncbi:MAG: twin-arginine translocase TatA/TatE family subunit [Acidaminococcaceae bacterium]|nr:twin-arginine translocase TatA/TatE family subunit [Acidaminococcaceae bacterium]
MEIGLGELLIIVVLAILLLEPKDLPRIARKSAAMYLAARGFMKKNWLALAEGAAEKQEE